MHVKEQKATTTLGYLSIKHVDASGISILHLHPNLNPECHVNIVRHVQVSPSSRPIFYGLACTDSATGIVHSRIHDIDRWLSHMSLMSSLAVIDPCALGAKQQQWLPGEHLASGLQSNQAMQSPRRRYHWAHHQDRP